MAWRPEVRAPLVTRRLRRLAETASIQVTRAHPHMRRCTQETERLAGFEMLTAEPADTAGSGWPMNKAAPQGYRLRLRTCD
jgi:hypothetical protein